MTSSTAFRLPSLRDAAHPLTGSAGDYDQLLELIGDPRFVLSGEATHGTHEFYEQRALRPAQRLRVRPRLRDSYEELFHGLELPGFMIDLAKPGEFLVSRRLERAIGVINRPSRERLSHYFLADMPRQFDTVIDIDETKALKPLELTPLWETGEPPETFPFGE